MPLHNALRWEQFAKHCAMQWEQLPEAWQEFFYQIGEVISETELNRRIDEAITESAAAISELTVSEAVEAARASGMTLIFKQGHGIFALSPIIPEGWKEARI